MVNYGSAILFLFSGSAMWDYLRRDPVPEGMRSPLSLVAAVWMLASITLVGVPLGDVSQTVTSIAIAAGLGLSAAAELCSWTRRTSSAPARDDLLTGTTDI